MLRTSTRRMACAANASPCVRPGNAAPRSFCSRSHASFTSAVGCSVWFDRSRPRYRPATRRISRGGVPFKPFYETYGRHSVYLHVTFK